MNNEEALTKEENIILAAEVLKPIIEIIDNNTFPVDRLKKTLENMEDNFRNVQAWPFQETMDKAEIIKIQNLMFEMIVNLIELRETQKEVTIKQMNSSPGDQILKQLGF
jgi:hypothetical protein